MTLDLEAVALLAASGDYDAALTRVDGAIARMPSGTMWRVRKADLLRQAGRADEARVAYLDARAALDRLPPARRQTRDAERTRTAIDTALATLPASVQGSSHP